MTPSFSGNSIIGHYRIVSKIGAGGMGEVYLAQDISELGRTVALKILPAEVAKDKDRLQRFTQEARTVSNLNHPNILTVHEFGQTDSASFIATEYIDGVTLREYLHSRRLKLIDMLEVAIQIVAALNAAHEAGVTHRDLKPENVMVRRDQIVKVLDFGLAKLSEPTTTAAGSIKRETDEDAATKVLVRTEPGLVMGTVSYMSPEQSAGKGVDQRADIWSVGVLLYEMIAGCIPFVGKDVHRQIIAIQEAEPVPLSQQVEGIPERLEEIVAKCLAKDRNERYQTARDLLTDLRNLRRKLDVNAENERTVAPVLRSTSGGKSPGAQGSPLNAGATSAAQVRTSSSAEYLIGEVKSHKLGVVAIFVVLIAALLGGGYWFLRNRGTASSVINSIAVLPFENRSGTPDSEYLSDGLAESLIYRLSQMPNLKVSPRSSVFRYKGKEIDAERVGNELGVDAVMSGRLIQRGDSLTISVDLVDVRNKKSLWGEQYERKMSDLLATQREIASAITEKLQLKLSGDDSKRLTQRYTNDNEAYQHYLQGRFYWNKRTGENIKKAIEQFKAAADKDPGFALAYAGLADCYVVAPTYTGTRSSETFPMAKANASRAIELDGSLAEPHAALGMINWFEWHMTEAEVEFKRAIELNPNYATTHHWYSRLLRALGRSDEAWAEIKRAEQLDPLSLVIINNVAEQDIDRGDLDSAVNECHRMIDLDPNFWAAHQTLGIALVKQRRNAEALAEAQKSINLSNRSNASLAFLGHVYGRNGQRNEAQAVIKELEERYAKQGAEGRDLAVVYSGLDDKDQAFAWLDKAFQYRSFFLAQLRLEPLLDPLSSDERWNDLLRRTGVAQ